MAETLVVTVTPPYGPPVVLDPIGAQGSEGDPGAPGADGVNGWTPILALVQDNARVVERVIDWDGGSGTKPMVGDYVGSTGFVTDIADATDVRGTPGPTGAKGDAGDPGAILVGDGANILTGDGVPDNGIGTDGDLYINNLNGDVYKKVSGAWVLQLNIRGPQGIQGIQGDQGEIGPEGPQGLVGADGEDGPPGPQGADGNDGAAGPAGAAGPTGAAGATIHLGVGVPSNAIGNVLDQYIDTATYTLYDKTSPTNWHSNGSFLGATGADGADGSDGADGATIFVAAGVPSGGLGNNGDLYIDTTSTNRDLYTKSAGSWSIATTLRGPQGIPGNDGAPGEDGNDGAPGAAGQDGSSILFGTTDPTGAVGQDGDVYYQTISQHIWTRSAGSWTDAGSLAGSPGAPGADGDDGAPGADGVGNAWYTGAGAPTTVSTWNSADKAAGITLSNTNHTATGASGNNGVRGTNGRSTGKWYFEFPVNTITAGFAVLGIGTSSFNINDNSTSGSVGISASGTISPSGNMGSAPTGKHISFAVDFDNLKFWARYDGGNWNGAAIGSQNPATNTGGTAFSAGTYFPLVLIQNVGTTTINTGDSAFVYSAPSGFSEWEGEAAIDGDMYLNTSNSDVYQFVSSAWVLQTNIKGATGATGQSAVLTFRSISAADTAVLSDANNGLLHPAADTTARTWTIPANASVAYPVGTALTYVNQHGAGAITISITSDTMRLAGAGTTGNRTLAADGVATAIKITSTEWLIAGTGLT
jgi:hypothetical protein